MVGIDGEQAFGGVGELHCVAGIVGEGDDNSVESGVELFDLAEAPTFVETEAASFEGEQAVGFGDGGGQGGGGGVKLGDGDDGFKPGILCENFRIGGEEFGT